MVIGFFDSEVFPGCAGPMTASFYASKIMQRLKGRRGGGSVEVKSKN
jgi:hypothetical protein